MTCSSPHLTTPPSPPNSTAVGMRREIPLLRGAAGTGLLLLLGGCQHDALTVEEAVTPTVQQRLTVDFNYGGHGYELASIYTDTMGHVFRLDTFSFIVSAIRAENDSEELITSFEGVQLVANAANPSNDFLLGAFTADHLHQLRIDLGLRSEENQVAPAIESPLADLYTGTTTEGYYFLIISGQVDGDGDEELGPADPHFRFRCSGASMLRSNTIPVHEDLVQGGTINATLSVDLELLLAGIDLLATPSSDGSGPINARLMDQLVVATIQEH